MYKLIHHITLMTIQGRALSYLYKAVTVMQTILYNGLKCSYWLILFLNRLIEWKMILGNPCCNAGHLYQQFRLFRWHLIAKNRPIPSVPRKMRKVPPKYAKRWTNYLLSKIDCLLRLRNLGDQFATLLGPSLWLLFRRR